MKLCDGREVCVVYVGETKRLGGKTMRKGFGIVLAAALLSLTMAAQAEERTMNAVAAWVGNGQAFQVGPDTAYFTGQFSGAMFVQEAKSGDLNAGALTCPGSVEIALADGSQQGGGHCIITTGSGDVVYAKWTCTGVHLVGCAGQFTLSGGTGKFKGISGEGPFVIRSALRKLVVEALSDSVSEEAVGIAVWSDFKYTLAAE